MVEKDGYKLIICTRLTLEKYMLKSSTAFMAVGDEISFYCQGQFDETPRPAETLEQQSVVEKQPKISKIVPNGVIKSS